MEYNEALSRFCSHMRLMIGERTSAVLWLTARGCTTSAVWGADGGEGDAHLTAAAADSRPSASG